MSASCVSCGAFTQVPPGCTSEFWSKFSPDQRPAHLDSYDLPTDWLAYRFPRTDSSSVETFSVNGTVITWPFR